MMKRNWPLVMLFSAFGGALVAIILMAPHVISSKDPNNVPQEISCRPRQMIVISDNIGQGWPAGSVRGCRCLLQYKGRVFVDLENLPQSSGRCGDRENAY